jgi:hypothetical protein
MSMSVASLLGAAGATTVLLFPMLATLVLGRFPDAVGRETAAD